MGKIQFTLTPTGWVYQIEGDDKVNLVGEGAVSSYLGINSNAKLVFACFNVKGSQGEPALKLRVQVENAVIIRASIAVSDATPFNLGMELSTFDIEA